MGVETEYDDDDLADRVKAAISQTLGERSNAYMVVEQSKTMPLLVALSCMSMLVAGIALGLALDARHDADVATDRVRRAELRVEGFTRALIAVGVDPYPHVKAENP